MTGAFLHTRSRKEAAGITREILDLTDLSAKGHARGQPYHCRQEKGGVRALATKPSNTRMLDECMAGLNQTEIKDVMNLCRGLGRVVPFNSRNT